MQEPRLPIFKKINGKVHVLQAYKTVSKSESDRAAREFRDAGHSVKVVKHNGFYRMYLK